MDGVGGHFGMSDSSNLSQPERADRLRRIVTAEMRAVSTRSIAALSFIVALLIHVPVLWVSSRTASPRGVALVLPSIGLAALSVFVAFRVIQLRGAIVRGRTEAASLDALSRVRSIHAVYPTFGGSAIDPEVAYVLAEICVTARPKVVVELGPGASSCLLRSVLDRVSPSSTITSVEHDDGYLNVARAWIEYLGLQRIELLRAPLVPLQVGGWVGDWYEKEGIERLPHDIDLLLVDGPPAYQGRRGGVSGRVPAFVMLERHLRRGALIVVDDADRPGEIRMVFEWLKSGRVVVHRWHSTCVVLLYVGANHSSAQF